MIVGIDASRIEKKRKTGVEWYSYYLIKELKEIPINNGIKFILYSQNKLEGEFADMPTNWENKVLQWPLKYFWTQIRFFWELMINPPDILFVPAYCPPLINRVKKIILTVHDIGFKRAKHLYPFWKRIYYSFVHYWGIKYSKKIIVPSNFTKNELIKLYGVNQSKIAVIPLGYDSQNYRVIGNKEKVKRVLIKYNIENPYFLYVGRIGKKKNIKGLVSSYKQLFANNRQSSIPDLILVGKHDYGYQEIKGEKSGFRNIKEIGYIDQKDLPYLYTGAEAFIFPSFYEGFGIPILEAMACGCPVISSNKSSMPEIAGNAALYFNPNDTNNLTKIIGRFLQDKSLKGKLRQEGLERVKNFSWRKCAQETMKILLN